MFSYLVFHMPMGCSFSNCRLLGDCWGRFWSIFEILVKRQSVLQVLRASKNNNQNWMMQKKILQKSITHVMENVGVVAALVRRGWIRMMRTIEKPNIVWIQSNYKANCFKMHSHAPNKVVLPFLCCFFKVCKCQDSRPSCSDSAILHISKFNWSYLNN